MQRGGAAFAEPGEIALSEKEFERVRARIHKTAGIALSDAKRTLVVSRLTRLVRGLELDSFSAYLDHLERRGSVGDDQDFVNALTTNLTRFYREDHHFDHLTDHVGELIARRPRTSPDGRGRLRIWSAGCSSGQEAYTIGLCLLARHPELRRWDFRILGTDIDTNVLARAREGIYPEAEIAELSPERARPFQRHAPGLVRVPEAVRSLCTFNPLNLMEPFPMKGPFDAIFCRNVAIYFDKPTQGALFAKLTGYLAPGGYLYIGHSENPGSAASGLQVAGKTVYRRPLEETAPRRAETMA